MKKQEEVESNLEDCITPQKYRKYRVGITFEYNDKKYGNMLCYVDARYVMHELDNIIGAGNWSSEFFEIKGRLYCKITIRFLREDGSIGGCYKMDCGTGGNFEEEKAETSDALKRTAVQFGIGRDLYSLPNYRVELNEYNGKWYPPKGWKPEGDK